MSEKKKNYLKKIIEKATIGNIKIQMPDNTELYIAGSKKGPSCELILKDWRAIDMVAKRGDIGLGEAYYMGLWDSPELTEFLIYCSLNVQDFQENIKGTLLNQFIFYFYNKVLRLNTKYGSKKNIFKHYDIGNDFYSLWLDPTMTYSSGIRNELNDTLEQAQLNKYNRIIQNLDLSNKKVLEIGCGWGGFAEQAIKKNANITGITISQNQYHFCKNRLGKQADILLQDYRDVTSKYERIVSIEMFEAVGEKYWSTYFKTLKSSLVTGGKAIVQTITIGDTLFSAYRKQSDYIRHHVFPGGMLCSKQKFCTLANKAGLEVVDTFEFGQDYAWTLKQWQKTFNEKSEKLIKANYSISFLRAWNFYLSLSIAAFESNRTNVMQIEISN